MNIFPIVFQIRILYSGSSVRARIFKLLKSPRIDSKQSIPPAYVAWRRRYDNLVPTRFLAPMDCLQIRAQLEHSGVQYSKRVVGEREIVDVKILYYIEIRVRPHFRFGSEI